MILRAFYFVFFLFFLSNSVSAQGHKELLEILTSKIATNQKKVLIASFMKENAATLSNKELAECYHDIGGKWHKNNFDNSEDYAELLNAISITEKSLELKRKLPATDQCTINKTLYNLGFYNTSNNNFHTANEYFTEVIRKGRQYCPNGGAEYLIELANHGLGENYIETGDFYKALEIYESLIQDYTVSKVKDSSLVVWAYIQIVQIYIAMDVSENEELIKSNLDKAWEYLKANNFLCCYFENRINQLRGNHLSDIEKYEESIKVHQEIVSNLDETDSVNLANVYNSIGFAYVNLGSNKKAEEVLLQTISFNSNYDAPYNNLGDLYVNMKKYQKALSAYQTAIKIALDINVELPYYELPSKELMAYTSNKTELLNHLVTKANAWLSYYEYENNTAHLTQALKTFTLADELVDLIKNVSNEQASKLYWREKSTSLYMKAVEVCYLLKKPEDAFYFMERNKALLLLEDLTHEEAKEIANLPQDLAQREFKFRRSIFLAENKLFETEGDGKISIDSLKSLLNNNKYDYQEFLDSLNTSYPDYAKFKKEVAILSYEEMMADYVSNEQLVLHYILNEEDGYGLLTSPEGTTLFQLEDAAQLNNEIDSLNVLLSNGNSEIATYIETSNVLFKKLIPEAIYKKIKGKQLTVIPDYTLQRVPFEALAVTSNEDQYLIDEVEISYAYSLSLLAYTRGAEIAAETRLLGFAPVNFSSLGLTELVFSEKEIIGITEMVTAEIMLNGKATKEAFLERVNDHQIIHLATHADLGDGENPWIAFAESKMFLKEIYATKNRAKMVVLSGCNTSNGTLKRGEGIMSLARGFFYSGAESVVSSLWPVNDEVGKEILLGFYENLNEGDSKSKALQKAKLNYFNTVSEKKLKHPYYWASFMILGNNDSIVDDQNNIWYFFGIGIIGIVLLFFILKSLKILK